MSLTTRIEDKAYEAIEHIRACGLTAPKTIVFGSHKIRELGELAMPFAYKRKALVVMGAHSAKKYGLADRLQTLLSRYLIEMVPHFGVSREPTVEMVDRGAELARQIRPALVIGVGGGSVIDCAKAIAALATNPGSVEEYLEGVGTRTLENPPLPMIAVPTAAGTGAEMTKNAVICSPPKGFKKSMRDERMTPTIALIDPELHLPVPPHVTAAGGADALTQLIESCITKKRSLATTALAHEGLRNVQLALSVAYEDPSNLFARERMAFVSMVGGVCLANAGLAMAHGIAAALGALFDVPHGLACGILLPHTLRFNNRPEIQADLAQALAAFLNQIRPTERTIQDGIEAIESLERWLQIPPNLKYLRLSDDDLRRLAQASMGSSMAANPIEVTPEQVYEFLKTLA